MWRLAAAADDAAIARHWAALNREDPAEQPPPRAYLDRTLAVLRQEPLRGRAVVLEVAGQVAGYALLMAFWGNEQGGLVCVVDELYVAASARGRGHASALLRGVAAGCPAWPEPPAAIELEVSPDNVRAQALYRRLGFCELRNRSMRRCPGGSASPLSPPPPPRVDGPPRR